MRPTKTGLDTFLRDKDRFLDRIGCPCCGETGRMDHDERAAELPLDQWERSYRCDAFDPRKLVPENPCIYCGRIGPVEFARERDSPRALERWRIGFRCTRCRRVWAVWWRRKHADPYDVEMERIE